MRNTRGFYVRFSCGIFDGYMNFHRSSLDSSIFGHCSVLVFAHIS